MSPPAGYFSTDLAPEGQIVEALHVCRNSESVFFGIKENGVWYRAKWGFNKTQGKWSAGDQVEVSFWRPTVDVK